MLCSPITYGSLKRSRWSRRRCPQTSRCPDAGRVSASQQDPVLTKSTRERQQGPAHGPLLTVSIVFATSAFCTRRHATRYPNLHEVRLIANKKDIAFVEYMDEGSATVAKDALHNYKLDGENKIKVGVLTVSNTWTPLTLTFLFRSRSRGSECSRQTGWSCQYLRLLLYYVFSSSRSTLKSLPLLPNLTLVKPP